MMKAAEAYNIIEKTAWGNESSMNYFLMENQKECAGIQSVVSNTTKHYELTSSDIDYHLLGTSGYRKDYTVIRPQSVCKEFLPK